MRILLAIDDSECSTAAVKAVIDQFRPAHTQVTVLHADDWPNGMPPSMAFAEGSSAAHSILASSQAAPKQRRGAAGIGRGTAPSRGFHCRGIVARRRSAAHHRRLCQGVARRSHRPGFARQEGARPDVGQCVGRRGATCPVLRRDRTRRIHGGVAGGSSNRKIHHDGDQHIDWLARQPSRREAPQPDGLEGFFVEPAAIQRLPDADVADQSLSRHDDVEPHRALDSPFQGLAGVVGSDLHEQSRRDDRAAGTIRAAAEAAAGSGSDARTVTRSQTGARPGSDAAARARAERGAAAHAADRQPQCTRPSQKPTVWRPAQTGRSAALPCRASLLAACAPSASSRHRGRRFRRAGLARLAGCLRLRRHRLAAGPPQRADWAEALREPAPVRSVPRHPSAPASARMRTSTR